MRKRTPLSELLERLKRLEQENAELRTALVVYATRANWFALDNGDEETDKDERLFVSEIAGVEHGWQIAETALAAWAEPV